MRSRQQYQSALAAVIATRAANGCRVYLDPLDQQCLRTAERHTQRAIPVLDMQPRIGITASMALLVGADKPSLQRWTERLSLQRARI